MLLISQAQLLLAITIALLSSLAALELPYEVLDSIVELSDFDQDFTDLTRVNVSDDLGPTRPIYRLDLAPEYVAYYEIDIGSDYVVFSSGKETGDYREVESGPDPRPTDVLIQQAQDNGQRCDKFYRLSPMGLTVCKNDNGTVVAANYNWTASIAQIKDWRKLDKMVNQSLEDFKQQWRERSLQRRSQTDWATTDVLPRGGEKKKTDIVEEALFPGSIMKLALGERFTSVDVYIRKSDNSRMRPNSRSEWQQKLCKVLVDVCLPEGSTKVNPIAIMETPNHLSYLKLEVRGNRTLVGDLLQWREIGFVVEIKGRKNEVIKKHFAINLQASKRSRRSLTIKSIPAEYDFPDYDQHDCCGCCKSGCSPVAWAQVFGYFDRRAWSLGSWSIFSPTIYGDKNTRAPLQLTDDVKPFVEDIRRQVKTYCKNGAGSTKLSNMHLIAPWFRARQGSKSRVVSFLKDRKRRSSRANGGSVQSGGSSLMTSKAVYYLNNGYPVIFSINVGKDGHSVVATKYKKRHSRRRGCHRRLIGFWWGKRPAVSCFWTISYVYEFYLHYGWGGYNNKWQEVGARGAYCAYVAK